MDVSGSQNTGSVRAGSVRASGHPESWEQARRTRQLIRRDCAPPSTQERTSGRPHGYYEDKATWPLQMPGSCCEVALETASVIWWVLGRATSMRGKGGVECLGDAVGVPCACTDVRTWVVRHHVRMGERLLCSAGWRHTPERAKDGLHRPT